MFQESVECSERRAEEGPQHPTSHRVSFFSRLFALNEKGEYVMASDSQVLAEAVLAIDYRYPVGVPFSSAADTKAYFRAKLARHEYEVFAVAFLDNQHRLLACDEMFRGSVATVDVHPREIARRALQLNASAVILSHNHPSFWPQPSEADVAITLRIQKALSLIAVRVIDHIIVAGNETLSLAGQGFLNR